MAKQPGFPMMCKCLICVPADMKMNLSMLVLAAGKKAGRHPSHG